MTAFDSGGGLRRPAPDETMSASWGIGYGEANGCE